MEIFIDESGSFVIPDIPKTKVSSVTSLIVPSQYIDDVKSRFVALRQSWKLGDEAKGSQLTETQVSDVIRLLRNYRVIVDIVCLDVGLHTASGVSQFKSTQAAKILENLTEVHQQSMVEHLGGLQNRLNALPNQLFLQAMVSILLVERLLENGTIYYSQILPKELARFGWSIDAKNSNSGRTSFEELWTTLLMPFLECNYSLPQLDEGDYSHFAPFEVEITDMTDHQKSLQSEQSIGGVDIKKLISQNLSFDNSFTSEGLQLVDIVSSAFSRAMNGTLGTKGWRHLGALMVQEPQIIVFDGNQNREPSMDSKHLAVLTSIGKSCRSIAVR